MALDQFCFRFLLANELAVVFFTCILVGGGGCLIYMRVANSRTASCEFINDAPIYASDVNAMAFVVIFIHCGWGHFPGGPCCHFPDNDTPPLCYVPCSLKIMIHHCGLAESSFSVCI